MPQYLMVAGAQPSAAGTALFFKWTGDGGAMASVTLLGERIEVPAGTTIEDAVRAAGHTPDSFLFLIGGTPVPMDTVPPEDSEVRAMRVASGG